MLLRFKSFTKKCSNHFLSWHGPFPKMALSSFLYCVLMASFTDSINTWDFWGSKLRPYFTIKFAASTSFVENSVGGFPNPASVRTGHTNVNQLISLKNTAQFHMVSQRNASCYTATTVLESLFNKVAGLARLQHRCFPVKFVKFLRACFWQNTFGGCFLTQLLLYRKLNEKVQKQSS